MPPEASCEICRSPLEVYTPADNGTPATWRCKGCGLVQLRLSPKEAEAWRSYYTDDGRYHRERVMAGFESFEARFEHDLRLAQVRMENLTRFVRAGRLLDVGASNGAFVSMACVHGFDAFGIEPDRWVVAQAKSGRWAPPLLTESLEDYCRHDSAVIGRFGAICFIDSFEHLLDPHFTLTHTARMLSDGGLLMIEMPDADAPGFHKHGPEWKHFKPREHAYLYGKGHVLRLLGQHGFCLIDTIVPYPDRRVYYARKA